ncbi:MAG: glutamate-5-semialdehyde dehydrogenase [Elusimicrobia bacterium RIFOXYA2_FULL_39_19]|nr:MAG: glutamate-5-semialdehyde dehydrogenase [Elusimicrobia bacterium RIFOXYA2_FULL_39_19]
MNIINSLAKTKKAARTLAVTPTAVKNKVLARLADLILKNKALIIKENSKDLANARKNGLSEALIDRLTLNEKRIADMASSVKEVIKLNDPIGTVLSSWIRPMGIKIQKVRVPLGVICMIYESRPNVTVDSASLCLKSGNAIILRGGKEAINSNKLLAKLISQALSSAGLSKDTVWFVDSTDRKIVYDLVKMDKFIDLLIPRGSEEMISEIRKQSTIPVLSHGKGLCTTYIDKSANVPMAVNITFNAKVQRPGVCNATETLLVHKDVAHKVLPVLAEKLSQADVEIRGCTKTTAIIKGIKKATTPDWDTEFHDLILAVKVVNSVDEAIAHINTHSSGHSETIITQNKTTAEKFLKEIDSSAVFHNASTRLHDGSVFGFGSELGISTQKIHARGTMGMNELTSTKYVVRGTGQIRK